MRRRRVGPLQVIVYLLIAFLYLPLVVVVLFAFNGGSNLSWPVQGLSLRWFRLCSTIPRSRTPSRTASKPP